MNRNHNFKEFIGVSPLSKTLRNELRPTEYTQRHIEEQGIIREDELRAEKRQELKAIMDSFYRAYAEEKLSNTPDFEWKNLFYCIREYHKNPSKENLEKMKAEQDKKRNQLHNYLAENNHFKDFFSAKLITDILPDYIMETSEYDQDEKTEKLEVVKLFFKFTTSFRDYFENRKNMFSKEAISSSICYRTVHENAEIFWQNLQAYRNIVNQAENEISLMEREGNEQLGAWELSHVYTEDFFNMILCQKGINFYNEICGCVNRHMNLYSQQTKSNRNIFKMRKLHKQILGISSTTFSIPLIFQGDTEVYEAVNEFLGRMEKEGVKQRLNQLGAAAKSYDGNHIYVGAKYYENVSRYVSGNWNTLNNGLQAYYEETFSGKGEAKAKKIKNAVAKTTFMSLTDIDKLFERNCERMEGKTDPAKRANSFIKEIQNIISQNDSAYLKQETGIGLKENEDKTQEIKNILDLWLDVLHWCQTFVVEDVPERDVNFYAELEEIIDLMDGLVPLYNRVRNYVTRKPYSTEKIKLNFNSPMLADGWSKSKEYDDNAIILLRDGKYYLGIFNVQDKPDRSILEGKKQREKNSDYKKMVYYLLPGGNKMLPKVFLTSKKGKELYQPSDYILSGYTAKKHIKGSENFDISFCHDLIDYYKTCIEKHPEWSRFHFQFSETALYHDISEFYRGVEKQGYRIEWVYISKEDMDKLDKDGKLYLFQIYNKDFSGKSTGTDNLHTMYLKNLFSDENLRDVVLKLNGEAELFYRKSSIMHPVVHKEGELLVNKSYEETYNNETVRIPVPDGEYMEIVHYVNGKSSQLSDEAAKYMEKVGIHPAKCDLVKDYRYTVDKFFLHLPITINFKADGRKKLNEMALKYISGQENLHIIGIDRGERNLIYISVIDLRGNIVLQRSYNIANGYDYKEKLKSREGERNSARKNWKEIGKIKELKEGYLSAVIHEITELMIKYNAIIVMEDLNYGFKRGRFKVERQVYQKFETMLIQKLNYFVVSKKMPVDSDGGLLRGYQLTYVPDSLKSAGRQCGFLFYVPAAYTSKIDPTTGFVNVFKFDYLTTNEARKDFLCRFRKICFEKDAQNGSEDGIFHFSFDYQDFVTYNNVTIARNQWEVYTYGERVKRGFSNGRQTGEAQVISVTKKIKDALEKAGIEFEDGHDLLEDICTLDVNKDSDCIKELFEAFKYTVQLRNSKSETEDAEYDRIISPVLNKEGFFFDSKEQTDRKLPVNADANGAYCIALKGLYEVRQIRGNWNSGSFDREKLKISNYDWLDFMQNQRCQENG